MFASSPSLDPELVWGLFTRAIGLIFLISFASLAGQVVRSAGRGGGLPISMRLTRIARDFPSWRRFLYFPTLLWASDADWMLRGLTWGGIAASVSVIYGGPHSFWGLLVCYVCYLSLDQAMGLIFPWDCLLFESTVLALFLPATHSLPDLRAVEAPAPLLAWAYRILVFRVMFGFGKQKFMGSTSKDLAYLKGFLIAQPLPSPLGWYVHKLPTALLKLLVVFMFIAEIPVPLFAMVPGYLSIVCAAVTVFLMIGIQSMGSFGYFSLLTIGACIPLLDNVTPMALSPSELFAPGAPVFTNAFLMVHGAAASIAFIFNSWVGQSWHLWSTWYRLPRVLQLPFDFFRFMHPFRWLHPFGVFPPNTSPGVKMSLLVEVTWDRERWHEVEFNYSPSSPTSAPKFVAPYHPRGDQAVIYETFGLNPTSLISSMVGPWDPYSYGARPAADVLLQRITEGHGSDFMKPGILAERPEPPVAARISTIMLEPAPLQHHLRTGEWWKRTYVGPHAPPRERDPEFWQYFLPEPEMWHFDAIFWRRRSRLGALIDRAQAGKDDPMQLALLDGGDLGPADVERFWTELVPMIDAEQRKTFDTLADVVDAVRGKFSRRDLWALQRLLGRFSLILVARLEPLYLGRGLSPEIPAKTYFHLWMVAQHIIGNGKDAYLAAVANPRGVATDLAVMTPQTGLYLQSVFRFESMIFEAQKLRLITAISFPHEPEEKAKIAFSADQMDGFAKKVAELAEAFSGFFCVMPHVRAGFQGPRYDRGFPERYPIFRQLDSGEVIVREYAPVSDGEHLPGNPVGPAPAE